MVECLDLVGYASNLVNMVIIKDSHYTICTHSVIRSIILYIACIMSFIWRTGVADTTTPTGLSNTSLLIIRIVMSVVLGIGVLYGILIMTTFQRYGLVMDKAWKLRIDEWLAEKAAGNIDPYTLDNRSYAPPPPPHWYPNQYQRPIPSSGYYPPYYGGGYPPGVVIIPRSRSSSSRSSSRSTRSPKPTRAHAPPIIVQLPPGSPHSTRSSSKSDLNRPGPNQQPARQPDTRVPAANSRATPPIPESTADGEFPRIVPERTLYPIIESSSIPSPNGDEENALGFSSGLEKRSGSGGGGGGDEAAAAPDDGNRVRFRLPSGSSDISDDWQGIVRPRKTHPRKTPKR